MSYLNHAYNPSPTIYGEASAKVEAPAMLAFAFDEATGKLKLPVAEGDFCVGIALASTDTVEAGDRLDVQIKDGCYWLAGEEIKRGYALMADTTGKAKKATKGNILAVALEDAQADKPCNVIIVRSTMGAGGGGSSYTLPQATGSALGGIKADTKSAETVECKIDTESGKLYVPTYPTAPAKATTAKEGTVKQAAKVDDSSGATDTALETVVNNLLKSLRAAGILASA